ncbi:helix-turn-helix domain-containing protein [Pannonibacter carbonis]|uniref:helix-turn-helix domain-containing protein n=1 Tax=Pannonibacter carbonis TaxID=2067569 RepID=UPI000D10C9BA|nr:helix-turn-helix transcriptional regulator [Pannonibacter carbonis]
MTENLEIIEAIKNARKAKGLSQTSFGELVGVPQSHISKIEKGGVDIKLSSLIQIARALDLEVKLVPKRALPAVESIVAGVSRDRTAPALSNIRNAQKALDHLRNIAGAPANYIEVFEQIDRALKGLQALNYDTDAYVRLEKATSPIWKITFPPKQFSPAEGLKENSSEVGKIIKILERVGKSLRELRNSLVHRHEKADLLERPAYLLEDDVD